MDGNKRTGLLTTLEFIYLNGFEIKAGLEALEKLALDTADSSISKEDITNFFKSNIKNK